MQKEILLSITFLLIITVFSGSFNAATNKDYLIIPGKSLGRTWIGEDLAEVYNRLGKPSEVDEDLYYYYSKDRSQYLIIHLKGTKVSEIIFTSPGFQTEEGINVKNHAGDKFKDKFDKWKFQWRFLQLRYTLKTGGLTFYTFNVDVPSDNPEYTTNYMGIVHLGKNPEYEPITGGNWSK